jgi:hypothetical protein
MPAQIQKDSRQAIGKKISGAPERAPLKGFAEVRPCHRSVTHEVVAADLEAPSSKCKSRLHASTVSLDIARTTTRQGLPSNSALYWLANSMASALVSNIGLSEITLLKMTSLQRTTAGPAEKSASALPTKPYFRRHCSMVSPRISPYGNGRGVSRL